jgi:hypothetical protein
MKVGKSVVLISLLSVERYCSLLINGVFDS